MLYAETGLFDHYDNRRRTIDQYQCDKVSVSRSSEQATLIYTRDKRRVSVNNIELQRFVLLNMCCDSKIKTCRRFLEFMSVAFVY